MSTIPSTPPRRTRVETPEAPLHGPTYDKQREKKEKEKSKMPKEKTKATSSVTSKTKAPAVTFALSPPGSPGSTGLPSPGPFDKDKEKTTAAATEAEDDPFVGPSLPSTTKFKKFKPPSVAQSIKNPFAKEISQQSNGAESLPTPAKTPSRKRKYMPPIEAEEELNSTSQVLFSDKTTSKTSFASKASETTLESILGGGSSSRATSRRKVNRGSLGRALGEDLFGSSDLLGSRTSGSGSTIEIYTDSNARVPEYDPSPDNPFVDHPPSVRRETEKTRKLRAKIKESETEFEALKAGREDGMVYTFRGMRVFRKFEDDNSGVLGGGMIKPRVLFPSARQHREKELGALEEQEELSALDDDNDNDDDKEDEEKRVKEAFKVNGKGKEKAPKVIETEFDPSTSELQPATTPSPKATPADAKPSTPKDPELEIENVETDVEQEKEFEEEGVKGAKEDDKEDEVDEHPDKQPRAPSVAPSVSSVASSNILNFGRRPRITKSVSNLSNSDGNGHPAGLRRSKRLASVEPEKLPPVADVGKSSIKQKLAAKRGRSDDSALEDTERWALGVSGGVRKRNKN